MVQQQQQQVDEPVAASPGPEVLPSPASADEPALSEPSPPLGADVVAATEWWATLAALLDRHERSAASLLRGARRLHSVWRWGAAPGAVAGGGSGLLLGPWLNYALLLAFHMAYLPPLRRVGGWVAGRVLHFGLDSGVPGSFLALWAPLFIGLLWLVHVLSTFFTSWQAETKLSPERRRELITEVLQLGTQGLQLAHRVLAMLEPWLQQPLITILLASLLAYTPFHLIGGFWTGYVGAVLLLGWNHPTFRWLRKGVEGPVVEAGKPAARIRVLDMHLGAEFLRPHPVAPPPTPYSPFGSLFCLPAPLVVEPGVLGTTFPLPRDARAAACTAGQQQQEEELPAPPPLTHRSSLVFNPSLHDFNPDLFIEDAGVILTPPDHGFDSEDVDPDAADRDDVESVTFSDASVPSSLALSHELVDGRPEERVLMGLEAMEQDGAADDSPVFLAVRGTEDPLDQGVESVDVMPSYVEALPAPARPALFYPAGVDVLLCQETYASDSGEEDGISAELVDSRSSPPPPVGQAAEADDDKAEEGVQEAALKHASLAPAASADNLPALPERPATATAQLASPSPPLIDLCDPADVPEQERDVQACPAHLPSAVTLEDLVLGEPPFPNLAAGEFDTSRAPSTSLSTPAEGADAASSTPGTPAEPALFSPFQVDLTASKMLGLLSRKRDQAVAFGASCATLLDAEEGMYNVDDLNATDSKAAPPVPYPEAKQPRLASWIQVPVEVGGASIQAPSPWEGQKVEEEEAAEMRMTADGDLLCVDEEVEDEIRRASALYSDMSILADRNLLALSASPILSQVPLVPSGADELGREEGRSAEGKEMGYADALSNLHLATHTLGAVLRPGGEDHPDEEIRASLASLERALHSIPAAMASAMMDTAEVSPVVQDAVLPVLQLEPQVAMEKVPMGAPDVHGELDMPVSEIPVDKAREWQDKFAQTEVLLKLDKMLSALNLDAMFVSASVSSSPVDTSTSPVIAVPTASTGTMTDPPTPLLTGLVGEGAMATPPPNPVDAAGIQALQSSIHHIATRFPGVAEGVVGMEVPTDATQAEYQELVVSLIRGLIDTSLYLSKKVLEGSATPTATSSPDITLGSSGKPVTSCLGMEGANATRPEGTDGTMVMSDLPAAPVGLGLEGALAA